MTITKQTTIYTLIITALFFSLASCKKDYLSKDDRTALFAAAKTAELDNIFTGWHSIDLTPTDYRVEQETDILSGAFTFKMVSFKVNNSKEYGALIIPNTTNTVPVQLFVGGFGLGITTNSVNLVLNTSSSSSARILAIPALRGQSLAITINGTVYTSPLSEGNHCDAFDKATDDVLAFLNVIQLTESNADVNRTGVRGGSRGCTVALLAGIRDTRVKRVVGVAGPTNMLELTAQNENDPTYECQFLTAYKNGLASLAETRNKMMASSPFYFAQHLSLTQLHLGLRDWNVPVAQGYDMERKIAALGNASKFQLFTYDKTHTDIATDNTELTERIELFFSQL